MHIYMYMYLPYITLVGINENSDIDNGPYDHDRRNPFADNPEEEPENGTRDIDDDDHDNDDENEDENEGK
jgi:hypothetical protein